MDTQIPEPELTPRQKRFCQEYVVDLNASQAAIRSGYVKKWAASTAGHLMELPAVKSYIAQLQARIGEKLEITAQEVVRELHHLAFCNIQDYLTAGAQLLDISQISRDKASAIESLKITEIKTKAGSRKTTVDFKLRDKLSALEKLGRHLGIFNFEPDPDNGGAPILLLPHAKRNHQPT